MYRDVPGEQLSEVVVDPDGVASEGDGAVVLDYPYVTELDGGEIVAGYIGDRGSGTRDDASDEGVYRPGIGPGVKRHQGANREQNSARDEKEEYTKCRADHW
jgi:hypothetical protein